MKRAVRRLSARLDAIEIRPELPPPATERDVVAWLRDGTLPVDAFDRRLLVEHVYACLARVRHLPATPSATTVEMLRRALAAAEAAGLAHVTRPDVLGLKPTESRDELPPKWERIARRARKVAAQAEAELAEARAHEPTPQPPAVI
jgi:hypothetical protein